MKLLVPFLAGALFISWLSSMSLAAPIPLVNHGDAWFLRKGTNAPQADWKTAADAGLDATWFAGGGGFGYGTDTRETTNCQTLLTDMLNRYHTLYARRTFTITNPLATNLHLFLRVDWDDGYIAWLDGNYLTNANSPGAPAEPAYNQPALANHECSTGQSGSNPQPAVTNNLGLVASRLGVGDHVLAIIGQNQSVSSTDFILVPDLFLDSLPEPPRVTNGVGGTLLADATWYASNGLYTVTNSLTVASNVTLTIEPGVTVALRQGCRLTVHGRLLADGTESQRITFTRAPGATTWERLVFANAADSRLRHCVIEFANCVGDHKDYYPTNCGPPFKFGPRNYHEAVVVLASHVDFDACSFTNLPGASATAEGDALAIVSDDAQYPGPASAHVRQCQFIRIGQGVHTRYAYVLVEQCVFQDKHGDNDDVDLYGESTPPCVVRSNLFLYPSYDDRINPTRCSAVIYGNVLYGSTDHGIVLRDVSQPVVFNNVLYGCSAGGISVQNGCEPLIVNNTLVNCNRAIKLFDHLDRINPPYCLTAASGKATLVNNIIWNSTPAFDLSGNAFGILTVHVSYSDVQGGTNNATKRANASLIGGPGNLDANPLFANATTTNFHLLSNSPCIDAGTNLSAIVTHDFDGIPRPLDGNGDGLARFDLGAYEVLLATADSNGDGIPDGWCWQYGFSPLDPSVAAADANGDGIPNGWCWRYGLHPTDPNVASGNPDGDAHTTLQEWMADTDPTNALSYLRIAAFSNGPPTTVRFLSSSNRQYTLFTTTNLAGSNTLSAVPGQVGVSGTGHAQTLSDTNAAPQKFYRIGASVP